MRRRLCPILVWLAFLLPLTLDHAAARPTPAITIQSQTSAFQTFVSDPTNAGSVPWSNLSSVATSDDIRAEVSFQPGQMYVSQYLKATRSNLTIPTGAMIIGIEAEVEGRVTDSGTTLLYVRPIKHGVLTNIPHTTYFVPGTGDSTYTLGNPTDLWVTPWTAEDLNSSDFGIAVGVLSSDPGTVGLDFLSVVIYYFPHPYELRLPLLLRP